MFQPILAAIAIILLAIVAPIVILGWVSSCKSADIYNGQNDTHYTCSDFFWAAGQINSNTETLNVNLK